MVSGKTYADYNLALANAGQEGWMPFGLTQHGGSCDIVYALKDMKF